MHFPSTLSEEHGWLDWRVTGRGLEAALEFAILGPLEVRDQHRRIEVSSAKERLLLAALVVQANEVVSADRLIEVLWGTAPPATAANTLQTYGPATARPIALRSWSTAGPGRSLSR